MPQFEYLPTTSSQAQQSQPKSLATSQGGTGALFAQVWSAQGQDAAAAKTSSSLAGQSLPAETDPPEDDMEDDVIDPTIPPVGPEQNRPAKRDVVADESSHSSKAADTAKQPHSAHLGGGTVPVASEMTTAERGANQTGPDQLSMTNAETQILSATGTTARQGHPNTRESQSGKVDGQRGSSVPPMATSRNAEAPVQRPPSSGNVPLATQANTDKSLDADHVQSDGVPSGGKMTDTQPVIPPPTGIAMTATNRTQTVATATANNAYAQQVAQQITAAIVQTSGGTTEIMLNPEELGRVRIAMTAGDAGMTVTLLAERPETTDLMRRHIEHLTRELRDMGYDNPTFNFEDQEDSSGDHQGKNAPPVDAPIDLLTTDPNTLTRRHVTLSGGLDLKL